MIGLAAPCLRIFLTEERRRVTYSGKFFKFSMFHGGLRTRKTHQSAP
jgi:hypothetical protein